MKKLFKKILSIELLEQATYVEPESKEYWQGWDAWVTVDLDKLS